MRVNAVQISDTIAQLCSWIDKRQPITRFVAVTGLHGIAESQRDGHFREVLKAADLVVPDGMPLVCLGRFKGYRHQTRVCGVDLMDDFCQETGKAYRHFFYGGGPGVAQSLAQALQEKHGIRIAGIYCPPFRPLTEAEEADLASSVAAASPDILWVGLSTPKQEKWMYEHRFKIRVPVMLGVGAAFDIHSGKLSRAPLWMRENGLEWLYRLALEPRRLWRRYLLTIPKVVWLVCLELLQFPRSRSKLDSRDSAAPHSIGESSLS